MGRDLCCRRSANPQKAAMLDSTCPRSTCGSDEQCATIRRGCQCATRVAGSQIINDLAKAMPLLISGSADLHGSTKNYIKEVVILPRTTIPVAISLVSVNMPWVRL